jgi:hypothetical protein
MSRVKHPAEKKRLAYERDHYNRNGESNKAWRKAKPLKKAKARRAYRKAANQVTRVETKNETHTVACKQDSVRQQRVGDWGSLSLREFVDSRKKRRGKGHGDKEKRTAD